MEKKTASKLSEYSISELLERLKALKIVCDRYERMSRNYDNSIVDEQSSEKYMRYSEKYNNLLDELESRVNQL